MKKLLIALVSLVVLAGAAYGGTLVYASIQNTKAPEELALSTTTPGTDSSTAGAGDATDATDLAGEWTVADGSQAGYRVAEVLNGQDVTVVGRTDDVSGTVTVEDISLTAAEITVSMTTITTDSTNRDGKFLEILSTSEYPTATFTLTEPVDISGIADGVVSVEASGDLTIAGVTQSVTVALEAQQTADGVEVSGSIPVTFSDFGVEAPDLGFVKVEDAGTVEMLLTLTR
ncbi:MAG: YceI family protein [Cellulomonadaceae bacterium]